MITYDIEIKKFLFSLRLFLYLLIEKRQRYDRRYWISSKIADKSRSIELTDIVFIIFPVMKLRLIIFSRDNYNTVFFDDSSIEFENMCSYA